MTNDTTADATRALKGMLGIGINRQVDNAEPAVIEKHKSKGSTGKNGRSNGDDTTKSSSKNTKSKKVINGNNPAARTSTPSKKNPNSHKKKKDGGSNNNSSRNSNDYVRNNNQKNKPQHQQTHNTGNSNSTKKGKKKKQMNDNYTSNSNNSSNGSGSGSTRGQGKNSSNNKQRNSTTAKNENYAWSAFQSPPDASTLPLPAFGSSFSFGDEGDVKQQNSQLDISVPSSDPAASTSSQEKESSTLDNINTTTTTTKLAKSKPMISTEKQTENEIKAMLNISSKSDIVTNEEKVIDPNDAHPTDATSASANAVPLKEQRNPSGVNLAKLTISSSSNATRTGSGNSTSQPNEQKIRDANNTNTKQLQSPTNNNNNNHNSLNIPASKDPIAMLLNAQSYGTANPSFNNHPYHYNNSMYPSHHHHQQHIPHHHHYPLHVAPPFFTIQVQVPPPQMLLPGRRMMLPGSPMTGGYPINVVVPEGVAPGMYIPVSIPNPNSGVGGNTAMPHHG